MLFIKDYDRRLVSISSRQAGGAFLADTKYDTIESARDFLRRFDASDVWFRAALVDEALGTSDSSLLGMSERDLIDTAARGIAAGRIVVATAIARPRKVSFDPLRPRAHGLDRVKFPGRAATVALAGVLRFDRDLVAALQAALWHEAGDDGISRVAPRAARARTPQQRREAAAGRPPEIDLSKDEIARLLGDGWLRLLPVNAETGSYALAWRYPGSGSGSEEVDGGAGEAATSGGRRRPVPPTPAPAASKVATLAEARALFKKLKAHREIPFDYPPDCCYARASAMCDIMAAEGVKSGKVWTYGNLVPVKPDGTPVRFPPTPAGQQVIWGYHVAPTMQVQDADGVARDMVMDPSLTSGPVTVQQWNAIMSGPGSVISQTAKTDPSVFYRAPDGKTYAETSTQNRATAFRDHVATRDKALHP